MPAFKMDGIALAFARREGRLGRLVRLIPCVGTFQRHGSAKPGWMAFARGRRCRWSLAGHRPVPGEPSHGDQIGIPGHLP